MTDDNEGFIELNDYIAQLCEEDPSLVGRMAEARKKLAPILYEEGTKDYIRMMRGEAP